MPNHPPAEGRLPFLLSQYRAMKSAIEEELRARYQPSGYILSPELRRLRRDIRVPTSAMPLPRSVGRMKCGLLMTNRVVSLKVSLYFLSGEGADPSFCGVRRSDARITFTYDI